ncbi:MAG: type II toxin-antitoxin system RelE/ParE family toxin [Bacteroidetes bacterium]|nr:type II toxin-antitoxin system RelE/ParE family toxin [Bacteroidota bacterium]
MPDYRLWKFGLSSITFCLGNAGFYFIAFSFAYCSIIRQLRKVESIREIIFYKDHFDKFFEPLPQKVKGKIDEVLFMFTIIERMPKKFFKSIEDVKGLFEVRVEYGSNIYRIFCCFDKGSLVVLFNGFQNKTQKTPKKELDKAEKIMQEYFNEQKSNNNGNKK